ncbi:hypothetical protein KKG41_06445 [Patescibacteria group bacterium]|nr:hypothetical protein [Patescibacteria group bacterium]MBU1890224.1 hypothetical protein [Patescibacteria group bacterium]
MIDLIPDECQVSVSHKALRDYDQDEDPILRIFADRFDQHLENVLITLEVEDLNVQDLDNVDSVEALGNIGVNLEVNTDATLGDYTSLTDEPVSLNTIFDETELGVIWEARNNPIEGNNS